MKKEEEDKVSSFLLLPSLVVTNLWGRTRTHVGYCSTMSAVA